MSKYRERRTVYHFVIDGQTPSHKNSKMWTGRMLINNKRYRDWIKPAVTQLKKQRKEKLWVDLTKTISPNIGVFVKFYVQDKRRRDLDNMLASVLDALKEGEIIPDDNMFVVDRISASYLGVDKDNPRAVVSVSECWFVENSLDRKT